MTIGRVHAISGLFLALAIVVFGSIIALRRASGQALQHSEHFLAVNALATAWEMAMETAPPNHRAGFTRDWLRLHGEAIAGEWTWPKDWEDIEARARIDWEYIQRCGREQVEASKLIVVSHVSPELVVDRWATWMASDVNATLP